MTKNEAKLKLFARALLELRGLLSHHLGSKDPASESEMLAAHLAYALHNDALAVLEGQDFDLEATRHRLKQLDANTDGTLGEKVGQLP